MEEIDVVKLYGKEGTLPKEEFLKQYKVSPEGLSEAKAQERLNKYGTNEVKQNKPKKWYNYFAESLFTPFNCILIGIAFVLYYTDVYLSSPPNYSSVIVIAILVIVSTLLDFIEEFRSNKAAEKLKELVATTTTVIRDGKQVNIPIKDVVLGDVVILSAGSMVPADLRIIEARDLYVGQSALTGESDSVKKTEEMELKLSEIEGLTDFDSICFMGTNVVSGSAKEIVIKTADSTYFGKVAHTLNKKPETAFQKGIKNVSRLLIRFMLVLIPLVFIINVWKHEVILSFTFAVAIAIGITPLLLPVILSSNLSKGAVRMSKKKTIVKSLDSIQSFGAMNILCTDKTGTLTEDKIVLEKYLDIHGAEDIRILKYAYLNSSFQAGLMGNIDEAVVKRAEENGLADFKKQFKLVDEIPFDFSRRRLSVVITADGKHKEIVTKGAVEEILSICTKVDYKGEITPITKAIKDNVLKISRDLNKNGLRVIAVCKKDDETERTDFEVSDEKEMTLIGFIGFLDPPKESAKESIKGLRKAHIRVMVLTGDNAEVTRCICNKVGITSKKIVTGGEIDKLSDMALSRLLRKNNIFVKLSPIQKTRIVQVLRESGNVVGYMGDGINDSPSLSSSDVGISVDTAVDIAKESADIILLEKDLNVLLAGVKEGRRAFANLMKYIKMAISFNFGEVTSVIIASIFLPFLPITPIQLLVQGLLYDFGQLTMPFDNVDDEYLTRPKKWDMKSLKQFMFFMGPLSSCFDMIVFACLWFIFGVREAALFQTIWFAYGNVENLFGMHIIRTAKIPFVQSNASPVVYFSSILLSIVSVALPFTALGQMIGLVPIPLEYMSIIIGVPILFCIVALIAKKYYIRKFREWI